MNSSRAQADAIFQAELQRRELTFTIDSEGLYEIHVGESRLTVDLENVRRNYARDLDAEAIAQFVDQLAGQTFAVPTWADVWPWIRYALEPADYVSGLSETLFDQVTSDLIKVLAFTPPDDSMITWITEGNLRDWQVSRAEVARQAAANMNQLATAAMLEIAEIDGVKLGMIDTEETPFKASLILAEQFRKLVSATFGWPVYVVAPARDFVYVIAQRDRSFLGRLGPVVVREFQTSGHPISREVLEVGDQGITPVGSFR